MQNIAQPKTTKASPITIARPSMLNRQTMWVIIFVVAVIWALIYAGVFNQKVVNERGWALTSRFFVAATNPELSIGFLRLTLQAMLTTLAFAVCGAFLSLVLGFVGGIVASEIWWQSVLPGGQTSMQRNWLRLPWLAMRLVLAFFRSIHEIIWGLLFVAVVGLDPLTAVLAIAIPFGAVTAKIFSEILDETPRDAFDALKNAGVSTPKLFCYTLLPQSSSNLLSYGFYRFECSIRAAAVLGIIGAGGLGHEIFLSMQSLRYRQVWTLLFALILLNGLTDVWSGLLRRRLGSRFHCGSSVCHINAGLQARTYRQDWVVRGSLILAALLVLFSFWYLQPDFGKLFSARTTQNFSEIARWAFPPDFNIFPAEKWIELGATTVAMSLLAAVGAALFAVLLSFPAASNFLLPGGLLDRGGKNKLQNIVFTALLLLTRGVFLVARSIPPPVWALIFLFMLFPGIVPGAIALGVYTLGVLGRLMAEVVENVDDRPLTALKAQGAGGGKIFTYGVLPATTPQFIGYALYRWEEIIRATVVIGLVGAGGLGRTLTEQLSSFDYRGVFTTLIIFVALIFAVDMISAAVRKAFRGA